MALHPGAGEVARAEAFPPHPAGDGAGVAGALEDGARKGGLRAPAGEEEEEDAREEPGERLAPLLGEVVGETSAEGLGARAGS
jgi:hypothetical protein